MPPKPVTTHPTTKDLDEAIQGAHDHIEDFIQANNNLDTRFHAINQNIEVMQDRFDAQNQHQDIRFAALSTQIADLAQAVLSRPPPPPPPPPLSSGNSLTPTVPPGYEPNITTNHYTRPILTPLTSFPHTTRILTPFSSSPQTTYVVATIPNLLLLPPLPFILSAPNPIPLQPYHLNRTTSHPTLFHFTAILLPTPPLPNDRSNPLIFFPLFLTLSRLTNNHLNHMLFHFFRASHPLHFHTLTLAQIFVPQS